MLGGLYRLICGGNSTSATDVTQIEIVLSDEELFLQAIAEGKLEDVQRHLNSLLALTSEEEVQTEESQRRKRSEKLRACLTMQSSNGWTALQLAAANNFCDIVTFLLSQVPEVKGDQETDKLTQADLINDPGSSEKVNSLALAIANSCDEIMVQTFLHTKGVEISAEKCTIGKGRNIVYAICRDGNLSLAQTILTQYGKEIFMKLVQGKDSNGMNALHAAALMKHADICALILQQDSLSPEVALTKSHWTTATTRDGSNALHFACRYQRKSYLTNAVNVADALDQIEQRVKDTVEVLLKHYLACNELLQTVLTAADVFGSTPAHVACLHGNQHALSSMLNAASQDALNTKSWFCALQDDDGHHPTHSAAQHISMLTNQLAQLPIPKEGIEDEKDTKTQRWLQQYELKRTNECLLMLLLPSSSFSFVYPIDAQDYCDYTVFHMLVSTPQCTSTLRLLEEQLLPGLVTHYDKETVSHLLSDHRAGTSQWTCIQQCFHFLSQTNKEEIKTLIATGNPQNQVLEGLHKVSPMLALLLSYISDDKQDISLQSLGKPTEDAPGKKDRNRYRCGAFNRIPLETRKSILKGDYSTHGVAQYLQNIVSSQGRAPKVIFLFGAGISTAAGIPDFRSSTGFYSSNNTRSMFSMEEVVNRPSSFYRKVKQIFLPVVDHHIKPTKTHAILRLFQEKGWLQRIYTQNVDLLEYQTLEAQLSTEEGSSDGQKEKEAESLIVECHGSFKRAYCTNPNCNYRVANTKQAMEEEIWSVIRSIDINNEVEEKDEQSGVYPRCKQCHSVLRPDVTFFGEPLPLQFSLMSNEDIPQCDLMVIAGTTLLVYPVASLPSFVNPQAVRMLANREPAGPFKDVVPRNIQSGDSKDDGVPKQWETSMYRDVFYQGDCDDGMISLASELGLAERLQSISADLQQLS